MSDFVPLSADLQSTGNAGDETAVPTRRVTAEPGTQVLPSPVGFLPGLVNTLAEPKIADGKLYRCRDHQKTPGMRHAGSVLSTGAIAAVV